MECRDVLEMNSRKGDLIDKHIILILFKPFLDEFMLASKIIGGMFGLEPRQKYVESTNHSVAELFSKHHFDVTNTRSGLYCLGLTLKPKAVWLPSYLCRSILDGVKGLPIDIRFYELDDQLKMTRMDEVVDLVQEGDFFLFINYFGFVNDLEIIDVLRKKGIVIIEDSSQALLTSHDSFRSDFALFSFRKFAGIPDGGLVWMKKKINVTAIDPIPEEWEATVQDCARARYEFDQSGRNNDWFRKFQRMERLQPSGPIGMSQLSRDICLRHLDWNTIRQKRVENYKVLWNSLHSLAVMPFPRTETVPLGFPIRVPHRQKLLKVLYENSIFPAIHWAIPDEVPAYFKSCRQLSSEIMTIPCDQRYGPDDMNRIATIVMEQL